MARILFFKWFSEPTGLKSLFSIAKSSARRQWKQVNKTLIADFGRY